MRFTLLEDKRIFKHIKFLMVLNLLSGTSVYILLLDLVNLSDYEPLKGPEKTRFSIEDLQLL